MKSKRRTIGDFGEEIALKYLEKKGYQILDRNFLKPYGEIDIIAIKNDILTFVEVKTRKNDEFKPASLFQMNNEDKFLRNFPLFYPF